MVVVRVRVCGCLRVRWVFLIDACVFCLRINAWRCMVFGLSLFFCLCVCLNVFV